MLVLVAESDELVRMVTIDLLEDAGYRTLSLTKEAEVVSALQSTDGARILVVGRSLERIDDGLALAHRVRADWPDVRVILTSGMGVDIERMLPPGARLLRKPFAFEDFLDLIEAEQALCAPVPSAAPVLPEGLPTSAALDVAAAPASEPEKS